MNRIKALLYGTTVVQKLNQGSPRNMGVLSAMKQTGVSGALFACPPLAFRRGYLFGQIKRYKAN
jgi:hypothetical protein